MIHRYFHEETHKGKTSSSYDVKGFNGCTSVLIWAPTQRGCDLWMQAPTFWEHQLSLWPSTNWVEAPTSSLSQHQLSEDTNLQSLQAPSCRQRHKFSPSTSLPPLFARLSNRIKMQQYRYVSAYQTTLLCSTSALCSSVPFNCSAHSSVPLLCTPLLSSKNS